MNSGTYRHREVTVWREDQDWSDTKEYQRLPANTRSPERGWEQILLQKELTYQYLDFSVWASGTVRQYTCAVLSNPVCGPLLQ